MLPHLLLDTHILIRWLSDLRRLSREQSRVLDAAVRRAEPIGLSAMSLLEIAMLTNLGKLKLKTTLENFFGELEANPALRVFPLTYEVALEAAPFSNLRDPADRAIVATARVHRLRLVTSDDRIIESQLVPVIS